MLVPMRTATSTRQTVQRSSNQPHVAQPHLLEQRATDVDEHQSMLELDLEPTVTAGQLYGYARISTKTQDLAGQVAQLRVAGVDECNVRTEKGSGAGRRPVLEELLGQLVAGDVLVVTALDRLGRVGRSLIELVDDLHARGIGLRVLQYNLDTTDPIAGRIILYVFAALAEAERALTVERTRNGLAAARAAGRRGGRPSVMSAERLKVARQLIANGSTIAEAARTIGVSRPTLSKHLQ